MDQIADIVLADAVQVCGRDKFVVASFFVCVYAGILSSVLSSDREVSELLQTPVVPVAGKISHVSESSQAGPQDLLGNEQPIHDLLLHEQLAMQRLGTCLDRNPQFNAKMRAVLTDWLVDVAANYKLRTLDSVLYEASDRPVPRSPPCPTETVAAGGCCRHVVRLEV